MLLALLLLCATTFTTGELSAAERKRDAAGLWTVACPPHEECSLGHVYRLLRVNGTVHALAYHQIGITGPAFSCKHYAWVGKRWVQRGEGAPGKTGESENPVFANL